MINRELLPAQLAKALAARNLPFIDMAARLLLEDDPRNGTLWMSLAIVALNVGAADRAREFLAQAESFPPHHPSLPEIRNAIFRMSPPPPRPNPGYLFIRPWGFGFWSDVDHVLGQLLLAEITGRTPIVYWGQGSRFADPPPPNAPWSNAWDSFFDPVSPVKLEDLLGRSLSCFPPVFNDRNLAGPPRNRVSGPFPLLSAHYFLPQTADIVISDFHTAIETLRHWIPREHPLHGTPTYALYRYLITKYLHPRPELAARIDQFAAEHFTGHPTIAVHIRATDKAIEDPELKRWHAEYPSHINAMLARLPNAHLFLLTDFAPIVAEYTARYGPRLITTSCTRSSTGDAIHRVAQPSLRRIGEEVLIDACLAARCDAFIGYYFSNVSCAAWILRDWPPSRCILIGGTPMLEFSNLFLYQPQ